MKKAKLVRALKQCVASCYFGATKRTRLAWCLKDLVPEPQDFIRLAVENKLLEEYRCGTWVSVTPVLIHELASMSQGGK